MIASSADLMRILPELVLTAFGLLIMLAEPFLRGGEKRILGPVALIGTLAALAATGAQWSNPGYAFHRLVVNDGFSLFFHFVLLVITALTILASLRYLERENINHAEYYALLLFGTVGMGVMAAANELILVFLGLETSSIATYVLIGFRRTELKSNESAMKYFLLGSFATAFLLYGIALLFGATGTTFLPEIAAQLRSPQTNSTLALMGMGLLFVGLGFKVASAPFQVWTPDVYEGAPTPVTAFLSAGPKAAAFAAFLRIFFTALEPAQETWFWVIWVSALLTMFVGNLGALVQTNIKRMLAYSSIAHAGYILVAFAARSELGVAAVLFYLVAYALMKLGAFSIVSHVSAGERNQEIDAYAGLHSRQPLLAACLTVFMLSLIGIPLTGGFLGKFYVFTAAVKANLIWLVILGVVNSVLSVGYYLRVVKVMYMNEPRSDLTLAPVPASLAFVLTFTALGTLYLGVLPGPVLEVASRATLPLP
ncbi:MAG: NADH-quinone oxidoreductase subunit N [Acidobacteria bacterium]|nr:NADH-quinone oxidoreductase subunit N [Acidobacteriota bacterium]